VLAAKRFQDRADLMRYDCRRNCTHAGLGNHEEVARQSGAYGMPSERLTHAALEKIPRDGATDLPAHGDPEPNWSRRFLDNEYEMTRSPLVAAPTQ